MDTSYSFGEMQPIRIRLHLNSSCANIVQRIRKVKLKTEPGELRKRTMKHRNTQSGARKNPDSSRVHGLRLAVNSSSFMSEELDHSSDKNKASLTQMPLPAVSRERLQGAATVEREENDALLTVGEVAETLRVSRSWVYERTRRRGRDRLPCIKLGKYLRFEITAIREWLRLRCHDSEFSGRGDGHEG